MWLYVTAATKRRLAILAAYNGTTIAGLLTEAAERLVMEKEANADNQSE